MDLIFKAAIFLMLIALGYFFGRLAEKRHYTSICRREVALQRLPVLPKKYPLPQYAHHDSELVMGNVVISVDYFKAFVAGLLGFVGGRINAYDSLLDRARREAVLRMQEQAQAMGADAVFNLKFETARIGQNAEQGLGSVEVLAYGTALLPPNGNKRPR